MIPIEFEMPFFDDHRGYFLQAFDRTVLDRLDLECFVQDNMSFSKKGVFRGLHYQHSPGMGKLVNCSHGKIIDFAYNLDTGDLYEFLLDKPNKFVYIPPNFAHGFLAVEDSIVGYKCTCYYDRDKESGVSYKKILDRLEKYCNVDELNLSERDRNCR